MIEEKTKTQEQYTSEYEKRLLEIMENSDYIPPEIGLAYVSLQIAKNPNIVAWNSGNSTTNNFQPNTKIEKFENLEITFIEEKQKLKELGIETGSLGTIISGINVADYYETFRRLKREHRICIHPRTFEQISTCTDDIQLLPIRKTHLNYTPRLPYHTVMNRKQISGKFVVCKNEKDNTAKPYEVTKLFLKGLKLVGELKYRNTKNFRLDYQNGVKKPAKRPSKGGLWLQILAEKDKAKAVLLNSWKLQKHKRPKPKYRKISQTVITNITTN